MRTSARPSRYARRRPRRSSERAYWLNVAPISARASRLTKSRGGTAETVPPHGLVLRQVREILGDHRRRRLEVRPGSVRVDRHGTVAREERRDLLLGREGERGLNGIGHVGQERVRVLDGVARNRREREIVAE